MIRRAIDYRSQAGPNFADSSEETNPEEDEVSFAHIIHTTRDSEINGRYKQLQREAQEIAASLTVWKV